MRRSSKPVDASIGTLRDMQSKIAAKAAAGRAEERAASLAAENLAAAQAKIDMIKSRAPDRGEPAGEDAAPAAAARARAQANQSSAHANQTSQLNKRIADLEAELAASKKINELRIKVYIVKFLTEILIFLAMMVWQDADSPPPSSMKRLRRNSPKSETSPVSESGIQARDDLTLLTRSNQHNIMHALQPAVVQETIARFGMD